MSINDTGSMLQKYHDTLEEIESLKQTADLMKAELIGIMEFNSATSIPDAKFDCWLSYRNNYDKPQWNNLISGEFVELLPEDIAKIMPVTEMTAQQLVDTGRGNEVVQKPKWGHAKIVEAVAKAYGIESTQIFEESRTPASPALMVRPKN